LNGVPWTRGSGLLMARARAMPPRMRPIRAQARALDMGEALGFPTPREDRDHALRLRIRARQRERSRDFAPYLIPWRTTRFADGPLRALRYQKSETRQSYRRAAPMSRPLVAMMRHAYPRARGFEPMREARARGAGPTPHDPSPAVAPSETSA